MRITATAIRGQLAAGQTRDKLLAAYPYLEREDVPAALEHSGAIVDEREVPVTRTA